MPEQNITPEQLKALQEKIKQMSPEELKEFQKKQCVFCQIVAGKVQSRKIFEDEKLVAILDINPANPGHILLFTREHYSIMPQIPDEEIAHVFMAVKALSNSLLRGVEAEGTNVIIANGIAAGQRAQHFIVHIIPRKENDGIEFILPQRTMEQNEIEAIGNTLIKTLGGAVEKEEEISSQKIPDDKKLEEPKKESESISLDDISKLLGVK